ncbi:unnamed protein product [Cyprideis torosa]|uniref:Uncharacterized protein n=1 Tax=Cyprideis torosa TaxID=163714 RepID=A0A7R8W7S0_9CRUS|nr:unnamed protein product [Cyprideis torosa]CAG0882961.1 unnamed protein product [Cyprideis torosa]
MEDPGPSPSPLSGQHTPSGQHSPLSEGSHAPPHSTVATLASLTYTTPPPPFYSPHQETPGGYPSSSVTLSVSSSGSSGYASAPPAGSTPTTSRYVSHASYQPQHSNQGYSYYPTQQSSSTPMSSTPSPTTPYDPSPTEPPSWTQQSQPSPYRQHESHICLLCRSPIPSSQAQPLSSGSHLSVALETLIGHAFASLAGHNQHLCPSCVDKLNSYNAAQHQVQQMKDELIFLFWRKSKLPMPQVSSGISGTGGVGSPGSEKDGSSLGLSKDGGRQPRFKEENMEQDDSMMDDQEEGEDWRDYLQDTACKLCAKVFTKLRLAIVHIKRRHREHLRYSCSICERPFTTSLALLNHTERVHASASVVPTMEALRATVPSSASAGPSALGGMKFSVRQRYGSSRGLHLRDYHGAVATPPGVPDPSALEALAHHSHPPPTESPSSYPLTPETPTYPSGSTPMSSASGTVRGQQTRSQQYVCNICGRRFSNRTYLIRDHLPLHKEGHDQICSVCNKGFKGVAKLKEHLAMVHSDIKKHICSYCGKEYARAKSLKEHEFAHRGEKPYTCKYCDYRTNISSNVYIHMRNKHKRERQAAMSGGGASVVPPQASVSTIPIGTPGSSGGGMDESQPDTPLSGSLPPPPPGTPDNLSLSSHSAPPSAAPPL